MSKTKRQPMTSTERLKNFWTRMEGMLTREELDKLREFNVKYSEELSLMSTSDAIGRLTEEAQSMIWWRNRD